MDGATSRPPIGETRKTQPLAHRVSPVAYSNRVALPLPYGLQQQRSTAQANRQGAVQETPVRIDSNFDFDFATETAASLADAGSWLVHIFTVIWGS
jgi:hypothetical protein